jgi:hypothetical protein
MDRLLLGSERINKVKCNVNECEQNNCATI